MKYYVQLFTGEKTIFDVVWGEALEDDTFAIIKQGKYWNILDIASGLVLLPNSKSKKDALALYNERIADKSFVIRIKEARETLRYNQKVFNMQEHRIPHAGDKCTYIDVKDSVILNLVAYSPTKDKWLVKDEWSLIEVSPDRIIKLSEVD